MYVDREKKKKISGNNKSRHLLIHIFHDDDCDLHLWTIPRKTMKLK